MNYFLILSGKLIVLFSRIFNLGNGSTWPGHIALKVNPNFLHETVNKNPHLKIIFIAGTNGKTTTGKLLATILENNGKKVFQNLSGANLLNGIASSFIFQANISGKINKEYAIFEIDENTLPVILEEIVPHALVLLNLFRDQLDRYGEIDIVAKKWKKFLQTLSSKTVLILNADDPQIAFLGKNLPQKPTYFGVKKEKGIKNLEHAADSTYCPNCGNKLTYKTIFYSHIGTWECKDCHFKNPDSNTPDIFLPLTGEYNKYNTLAAAVTAITLGFSTTAISNALKTFHPAFGRQEKIIYKGKNIQIFLAKNPTGFNESLKSIQESHGENFLFVLNDRIPDGRDVSWIWDIDLESYVDNFKSIVISGDRTFDMGLRVAYSRNDKFQMTHSQSSEQVNFKSNSNFQMIENLNEAIEHALNSINKDETLYILPTYSAMLEVRKILTGKSIL